MTSRDLHVSRRVVADVVRLAVEEVPGVVRVGRGGPLWRRLAGRSLAIHLQEGRVRIQLRIVARGEASLAELTARVRAAVATTLERLLDLRVDEVTVVVDAVEG
jgi:uncharacterized alkaline shock family protein YloU